MNFLIIVGFCLTAAAAVPRNTGYTDTTAAQRSYSPYNPYYCGYHPSHYNCRPPYYYPYYYETPSYSCYYKQYYNPYYYNQYYNYYRPPCYYKPGYYYGNKGYSKGEKNAYRSSYGHSGHEDNYNVPLYYAPGYQQGYQTNANDHPSLNEQYNYRPGYLAAYRSSYGHSGQEANYNVPLYYAPGYQQGYQTNADEHPSLNEQYNRPGYLAPIVGDAKHE